MPTVYRVTAVWSGFQGAPGYSKFSFADISTDTGRNAAGAAVRQYFQSQAGYIPNGVQVLVTPVVQEYDSNTGALQNEFSMSTAPTAVIGTAAANPYAAGAGYVVTWKTGLVYNGRRVNGRTFHVPSAGGYDVDGSLSSTLITTATAAANALIAAAGAELAIWAGTWSHPAPPAHPVRTAGGVFAVSSAVVKDAASSLRTRRT